MDVIRITTKIDYVILIESRALLYDSQGLCTLRFASNYDLKLKHSKIVFKTVMTFLKCDNKDSQKGNDLVRTNLLFVNRNI